jgi:hypothetical protein
MFVITLIIMTRPYACPFTFKVSMENHILN